MVQVKSPDSAKKILSILSMLSKVSVTWGKGEKQLYERFPAQKIVIGPSMFRDFTCPDKCIACCLPFTLDYVPDECDNIPSEFTIRKVVVNGSSYPILTFDQRRGTQCPYLIKKKGRKGLSCVLFPTPPISCKMAPQVQVMTLGPKVYIYKKPFGRAWQMNPIPQCKFGGAVNDLEKEAQLFERLGQWADWFGIPTYIPDVIDRLRGWNGSTLSNIVVVENIMTKEEL